jgi:hypothetical protein
LATWPNLTTLKLEDCTLPHISSLLPFLADSHVTNALENVKLSGIWIPSLDLIRILLERHYRSLRSLEIRCCLAIEKVLHVSVEKMPHIQRFEIADNRFRLEPIKHIPPWISRFVVDFPGCTPADVMVYLTEGLRSNGGNLKYLRIESIGEDTRDPKWEQLRVYAWKLGIGADFLED